MINPIEKNVERSVKVIEYLFAETFYKVNNELAFLNDSIAKLVRNENGLYFECVKMTVTSQIDVHKLVDHEDSQFELENNNRSIYFRLQSLSKFKLSVGLSGHTKICGYLKDFQTSTLNEFQDSFYRAVILTNESIALSGFFDINNSLTVGNTTYASGIMECQILQMKLHLYSYSDEVTKRKYFFIESQSKVELNEFVSCLDELVLAISYLTGVFLGREIYILGSNEQNFENVSILSLKHFFDDLKSGFSVIPDVMLQHDCKVKVMRFPIVYFQELVNLMHNSLVYKRAILLICQGHTEPNYVRSSLYSVALETITNKISEQISEKIKPITDKPLADNLRRELKNLVLDYKDKIGDFAYKKIVSDIERINSPTNKQKLQLPFIHYNIKLPDKDIAAIEKRNDFLHGRIPDEGDSHALPIINCRLLFCINCLVMKHINFSGYILYHTSFYQRKHNMEIEEYPIRKI
jgi:hypothetical protein